MTLEIEAMLKREQYFKGLAEVIREWGSDPQDYDLRLVAHELRRATGTEQPRPMRLSPDRFIALLIRCQRRGATPPRPVPPPEVLQLRRESQRHLLRQGVLLPRRDRFAAPAAFCGPWPPVWEPVPAVSPGDAISRAVMFDRPDAPEGELMLIAAEAGHVPGAEGQQELWYRLYCAVRWHLRAEVQIIAEGTASTLSGARAMTTRSLRSFLHEQCDEEGLPDHLLPPARTQVYFLEVPVRLSPWEAAELSEISHQAELRAAVTSSVRRYAARRRKLRKSRQAARQVTQPEKKAPEEPNG